MADAPLATGSGSEPYQALYRRYRPQRFADVRGQEHVTRALRNAVRDDKVAHAYLFSGPRGTGKTSTARILAMALNCANPVDGEPDGTCASCVDIRQGSSLDVQELDAASNRKIDEMRDLLSRVALGISGRWKVYIVDEVHQLTNDAASMLLKTLEEPPGHVIFVLATTDPQKVLPTIRSRTQHFEFRLLGSEVLGDLLRDVNERAALGIAPEAIDLVVRRGHGSARDALSVLDQVAAAGEVDDDSTVAAELVDAVADRDAGRVLTTVAEAMSAGRDPRRVAADLLEHLRNGFLAIQARGLVHLADDPAAEVEAQARRLGLAGIVRALEVVGLAAAEMRDSVDTRVTLEVALVRLAAPQADESTGSLLRRVEQLEAQVAALLAGVVGGQDVGVIAAPAATSADAPVPSNADDPAASRDGTATATLHLVGAAAPPDAPAAPPNAPTAHGRPDDPAPQGAAPSIVQTDRTNTGPRRAVAPSPGTQGGRAKIPVPPPQPGRRRPDAAQAAPPAEPAQPVAPERPPAAEQPAGPARPVQDEHPVAPAQPAGPARPVQDEHPVAPAQPAAPERPVAPEQPAGPVQPVGPEGPGGPAVPTGHLPATEPAPSTDAGPAAAELSTAGAATGPPTRDDLTKAWGDEVLPKLRPAVKAYVSSGRFVDIDGSAAVYALPDQGLLVRARNLHGEIEAALAAHFGRPVPLRLILDGDSPAMAGPATGDPPAEDDPGSYDLDDLEDAGPAVVSPEQRLLEAFPGAEEVTP